MNKKFYSIKGAVVAAVLAISGSAVMAQPCTPVASIGCGGNHAINAVTTSGGINNITNNATGCSPGNYRDYTTNAAMKVTQEALKSIDLKVTFGPSPSTPGGSAAYTKVYIDWNGDNVFGTGEQVIPTAPGPDGWLHTGPGTTVTIPIAVPGYAKQGIKRMRVVTSSNAAIPTPTGTFGPCTGVVRGEYEDYNFEVINPCKAPNVISVANVDYKSADIAWTEKPNRDFYEYVITTVDTIPHDTVIGFTFTTNTSVDVDTFQCDTKYYVMVRVICDTAGKSRAIFWDKSGWIRDSFTTQPCCYTPNVKLDQIGNDSVRATWDPIPTAYGYEYAITTLTDPPQQGHYTVNTSVLFRGLSPKQTYFVFIRARCNPTPLSNWDKDGFKTLKGLSVNELSGKQFSIDAYPNPVGDNFTVRVNGTMANNATVTVTDMSGKVVYQSAVTQSETTISSERFASGVYVIKYADDAHNEIMKVIK